MLRETSMASRMVVRTAGTGTIVTGGTRGIGKAICQALQADGMTVVANYAGNDAAARAFTEETGHAR